MQEFLPYVVQSNEIIEKIITKVNVNQLRFLFYIMSFISPEDKELIPIRINRGVLDLFLEGKASGPVERRRAANIRNLLSSLASERYTTMDKSQTNWYPWFQLVSFDRSLTGGALFKFNDLLTDHLCGRTENFAILDLSSILSFRSVYSIMLYELLCGEAYKGKTRLSINYLRHRFNLFDEVSGKPKLDDAKEFNRNLLNPCVAEINEKSNLDVSFSALRSSEDARRIDGYEFTISRKENYSPVWTGPDVDVYTHDNNDPRIPFPTIRSVVPKGSFFDYNAI